MAVAPSCSRAASHLAAPTGAYFILLRLSQMQELFWRGDIWFDSLSERSQIFILNNQDFISAQLPKTSEFSCVFSELQSFSFCGLPLGGSRSPGKTQCYNQINFWSRNCMMRAFIFSAVVWLWTRGACPPATPRPSTSPGAWYHSFPLQQGRFAPLLTWDQVFKCCAAPRSQHSCYIQKSGKSHCSWTDSLGK